jgi:hypothetical protein
MTECALTPIDARDEHDETHNNEVIAPHAMRYRSAQ